MKKAAEKKSKDKKNVKNARQRFERAWKES